jgi:hypothetical protein
LQSSAYSWFDRCQTINSNAVAIDDVVGLAQIMCHKNNFEFDSSERDSMFQYGFLGEQSGANSQNNLQGHAIDGLTVSAAALSASTYYYDYSVPLPSSLLGPSARNFCPIGALQALNVSLWTNSVMPIVYSLSAAVAGTGTITCTLDNLSIDAQYVYLDQKSASLLNLGKEYYVHSITNRLSTGTIAALTTGQTSVLVGLRGRSVRSLAARFSQATQSTAGSANGVYDSQLIPCSQLDWFLGGKNRFPNVVHNSIYAPSTVFEHALQAAEAFTPDKTKYGGTYQTFCKTVAGGSAVTAQSRWATAAGSTTGSSSLAGFVFGEDLRVASSSQILDGYDMSQSASHFLELNIAAAPTYAINCSFIAAQDIIFVIDLEAGTIESRV